MVFKKDWELANFLSMPGGDYLASLVAHAFPGQVIRSFEACQSGCANHNILVQLQQNGRCQPWILRVYKRQRSAFAKESAVGQLLKNLLPVPEFHSSGMFRQDFFVVMPCLPGVLLRDVVGTLDKGELSRLMCEVGKTLAIISKQPGPECHSDELTGLVEFGRQCLSDTLVSQLLGDTLLERLSQRLTKGAELLAQVEGGPAGLVHGDFDPANILVERRGNSFKVSGILDWEFSFGGSFLWDASNMLRYAFEMPGVFQKSFLAGLKQCGVSMPRFWEETIRLLNILSLLDLLKRTDP